MKAGRELDALVAQKVFKIMVQKDKVTKGIFAEPHPSDPDEYFVGCTNEAIKHYSTDISAAWELMEKLKMLEPAVAWNDEAHVWVCVFQKKPYQYTKSSESAAHAISLAARAAFGEENDG